MRKLLAGSLVSMFSMFGISGAWGQSFDITARVTVDNMYAFGWGDANSILAVNYWPNALSAGLWSVQNTSTAAQIYTCAASSVNYAPQDGPEVYPNLHPTITDYLYIVAWADTKNWQGAIGDFRDNVSGKFILTGDPNWQVFATGIDKNEGEAPDRDEVNAQILKANGNLGVAATSSVGWVGLNSVAGRVGRLATRPQTPGQFLPNLGNPGNMPSISCLNPNALWMWYQDDLNLSDASFNAFYESPQPPGKIREFLIFRLPVKAFAPKYDIEATKSSCALTHDVKTYGMIVRNVGDPIAGPAQVEVVDLVPPGLTVNVSAPAPWQCTPSSATGPDVITCKYTVQAGTTIGSGDSLPAVLLSGKGEPSCPNCMRARLYFQGKDKKYVLAEEVTTKNNTSCK